MSAVTTIVSWASMVITEKQIHVCEIMQVIVVVIKMCVDVTVVEVVIIKLMNRCGKSCQHSCSNECYKRDSTFATINVTDKNHKKSTHDRKTFTI